MNLIPRDSNRVVDASLSDVIASDCMATDYTGGQGKIFLRVPESLKQAWIQACEDRKIKQNDAGEALVSLVVSQDDPVVQSQMFGQLVPPDGKIVCSVPKRARVGVQGSAGNGSKKRPPKPAPDANRSGSRH